jgi:quercetin dioxygenase-like cupin family protein
VTFDPGARTAWHPHPLGQTLIVTAGTGWVQPWGGPTQEIREDDVVWTPPGQKHPARRVCRATVAGIKQVSRGAHALTTAVGLYTASTRRPSRFLGEVWVKERG